MKQYNINIYIDENTDILTNFTPVSVSDIDNISNGSVNNIICSCIDRVNIQDKFKLAHILCNKLVVGGQIKFIYLDIEFLKVYLYRDKINNDTFNQLLPNINSLWSSSMLQGFIKSLKNFQITEEYNTGIQTFTTIERIL